MDVVAINAAQWDASANCGRCVQVTGALGTVTARVVDQCGPCAHGSLDLSEEMFPKIDSKEKGRVPITWNFVTCPSSIVSGPLEYHILPGSTRDSLGVQIRNHAARIESVEINGGAGWVTLIRSNDDYFHGSGVGDGPYSFRTTNLDGVSVTDDNISASGGSGTASL